MMMKCLLLIAGCLQLALSTLKVYQLPLSYQDTVKDSDKLNVGQEIQYSVANFGKIPYGKRIIGYVMETDPVDACKEDTTFAENFLQDDTNPRIIFALIKRGECTFTKKTRTAAKLGANLAIIYDSKIEFSEYITMGDDGYGDFVPIPSVFIPETSGEALSKALKSQKDLQTKEDLMLYIEFNTQKFQQVNLTFFLVADQEQSFTSLVELKEYWPYFQNRVSLNVVFRFYPFADLKFAKIQQSDCLNENYCSIYTGKRTTAPSPSYCAIEQ